MKIVVHAEIHNPDKVPVLFAFKDDKDREQMGHQLLGMPTGKRFYLQAPAGMPPWNAEVVLDAYKKIILAEEEKRSYLPGVFKVPGEMTGTMTPKDLDTIKKWMGDAWVPDAVFITTPEKGQPLKDRVKMLSFYIDHIRNLLYAKVCYAPNVLTIAPDAWPLVAAQDDYKELQPQMTKPENLANKSDVGFLIRTGLKVWVDPKQAPRTIICSYEQTPSCNLQDTATLLVVDEPEKKEEPKPAADVHIERAARKLGWDPDDTNELPWCFLVREVEEAKKQVKYFDETRDALNTQRNVIYAAAKNLGWRCEDGHPWDWMARVILELQNRVRDLEGVGTERSKKIVFLEKKLRHWEDFSLPTDMERLEEIEKLKKELEQAKGCLVAYRSYAIKVADELLKDLRNYLDKDEV